MTWTWESYSGSVLSSKDGYLFDTDTLKAHIVDFIRTNIGTISLGTSGTETTINCYGDYPTAENMELPTIVVSVQGQREMSEYIGNFLFEYVNSGGGVASSGSYDTVYGHEKIYIVRCDSWAKDPWMRDSLSGKIDNLFNWYKSPQSNTLYDLGIKQVKTVSSDLIGYDDADRFIKDVAHHNGATMVYRRYLDLLITTEVRFIPPTGSGSDGYLVGEVPIEVYQTSSGVLESVDTESGTLSWSGTESGS